MLIFAIKQSEIHICVAIIVYDSASKIPVPTDAHWKHGLEKFEEGFSHQASLREIDQPR